MALLYKISSSYKMLSAFMLLVFASNKHKLVQSSSIIYLHQICIVIFYKNTPNTNTAIDTSTFNSSRKQGFTLVELIVTVCVLAIIVTIAVPIIRTQLARMEAKRIKSQLETSLALAKAESYIRRQNVIVCLSDTGGRCHRDSDKTLLLFIDKNDNNHFDAQIDRLIIRQSLTPKYSKLSLRVGSRRHYIKFWGDSGKPRGHFGHIKYCPTSTYNHTMYQISFSQGGQVTYKPNESHPTDCGQ
ncbi:GspH/FimT family pseudopilin [Psychrobacter glacincola]|uniref:GspH/FimT family pseudopilin n=1 Tax=Psychrobacter glacincola TaxID=56810 RepID=UPI003FD3B582